MGVYVGLFLFLLVLLLTPTIVWLYIAGIGAYSQEHNANAIIRRGWELERFRTMKRWRVAGCGVLNPRLAMSIEGGKAGELELEDRQNVTVTVSGVMQPSSLDWIALISPSDSDASTCFFNKEKYLVTGDLADLPLLCHYPVKFQYLSQDESYLLCRKRECAFKLGSRCIWGTCNGSVTFDIINIRTDIEFVFFTGGFDAPCILERSKPLRFSNPSSPLYGHLSSIDSTGTSMRLTWISGDARQQWVRYGNGQLAQSNVGTFEQSDMCGGQLSAAIDFGWHDPGYVHSAIMTGLSPSKVYSYEFGSDVVGWSESMDCRTPPASGDPELRFIIFGDMGKMSRDLSAMHYSQPGALSVISAIADEAANGIVDMILHIGDISYATGFLVEWDYFLDIISPVASRVSYMTAIGNHERDFPDSGTVYETRDSGGECGIPYENYFQMPTEGNDKPWYSIESGPVHFTVMSTEHDWKETSQQYQWIQKDLASVNRSRTPWLIFIGHRPQYASSNSILQAVDKSFVSSIETLLFVNQVDLVFWGHVHNFERTCAVYQRNCYQLPCKDSNGIDTFYSGNYTAPIHAVVGMAGFTLDGFSSKPEMWSLSRISKFGYGRVNATRSQVLFELVLTNGTIADSFRVLKT